MSKPLVSISLLCSNRKNTIRKCLDSLQPLRDAVATELVIVDTGCDTETRAILEEYTDKIIDFEWCNDFSKARNAGLEKCSGEWFLYIDDDEWFMDMDEIIEFFGSGRYKEVQHAFYIQRNYTDHEERRYSDTWVSRMIRRQADTHFVSSIHEYPSPIAGRPALLHSAVKHFGYIYDSEDDKYRHSERNSSLLWNMIEKEYENLRWWGHLIQEYIGIKEYNKLMEVCDEALEICKGKTDRGSVRAKAAFYMGKIRAAIGLRQMKKAADFYEEAVADQYLLPMAKGALYHAGAEIYCQLKEMEKCRNCGEQYLEIYHSYKDNEQERIHQETFLVRDVYQDEYYTNLMSIMVLVYMDAGLFEDAIRSFRCMDWKKEAILRIYPKFLSELVKYFCKYDGNAVFTEMLQTMLERNGFSQQIIKEIKTLEEDSEKLEKIAEIVSQVESEHYYVYYLKILHADKVQDAMHLQEYYEGLFGHVLDILNFHERIWEIAERNQVDLEQPIKKILFERWKTGVDIFCEKNTMEVIQKRYDMLQGVRQDWNIRYEYLDMKVTQAALIHAKEEEDYDTYREKLCAFVEQTLLFYQKFFNESAFEGEMEMLPAACRVAVRLYDVLVQEECGDYRKILEDLKAIIGVYPPFDDVIKKYSKLYGQVVMEKRSTTHVSSELQELAEKLAQKAQELLAAGDVENAQMILKQVSMYLSE